ncbi:MAG: pilin [Gammaproteobacteria bacterium]|nr:pilin [Gammaproteobacteria bacterium]
MDENTYKIIITNTVAFDKDKSQIIKKLAVLFNTSDQKAAQLLSSPETVIKNNINKAMAVKYLTAIHKTGANARVVNTATEKIPKATTAEEKHQNLDELGDISEKIFCLACGAVKDSVAACLHCGFDPQATDNKNKRNVKNIIKYSGITVALIAAFIIAYQLALPFYNVYAKKQKIAQGLELAFDTRDQITTLILETNFWPSQNIDANLPKKISNGIIESLIVGEHAVMTVTLRARVLDTDSSKTIIFKPSSSKGKLIWNCQKGTLENEFRPDNCRNINQ